MTRDQMLAELRVALDDVLIPFTWTTPTLLGYLAEGQDKFCEDTGYFTDITNFKITLETGDSAYAIPDRVIQILSIWDGSRKLGKVLTGDESTGDGADNFYPDTVGVGNPALWQTDKETGVVVLTPTPTAEQNGTEYILQVWRYSLYDLAGDGAVEGEAAAPEIPSRFHRACIEYAVYGALRYDTSKENRLKAADCKASFNSYVQAGRNALRRVHNTEVRIGSDPAYRT